MSDCCRLLMTSSNVWSIYYEVCRSFPRISSVIQVYGGRQLEPPFSRASWLVLYRALLGFVPLQHGLLNAAAGRANGCVMR